MLAEIYMVRLEAAARVAKAAPPSNPRLVPFINPVFFKDNRSSGQSSRGGRK